MPEARGLEIRELAVGHGGRALLAGISLRLGAGEVLGLSGPSGCGKTTLGRALAGLHRPLAGEIVLDGRAVTPAAGWPAQYLHQAPLLAMNPRWRVGRVLAEPGPPDAALAARLGVPAEWAGRFPHELSGGQLQRVSILRALTARPRFLIADEITSALDPVAQAGIWRVLRQVIDERGIGVVAISHDRELLDKVAGRTMTLRAAA